MRKKCFSYWDNVFLLMLLMLLKVFENESRHSSDADKQINQSVFKFHHMDQCKSGEFYDLDYFKCLPCDENNKDVVQSEDKFSCQCSPTSITKALYDTAKRGPICIRPCSPINNDTNDEEKCISTLINDVNKNCVFKYINLTIATISHAEVDSYNNIRVIQNNPNLNENCSLCDLTYNSYYEGYCIFNALLKSYTNYNTNRQQKFIAPEFKDLKFIAFFCLRLQNATACNHLANLCIITNYNFGKNSPCSAFILSQASESLLKHEQLDEEWRMVRPFLFYKKGKQSKKLLGELIRVSAHIQKPNIFKFFATVYTLDGTLSRWGSFHLSQVNFCQFFSQSNSDGHSALDFEKHTQEQKCDMSLEKIIDLALVLGNKHFMSIYLNITTFVEKSRVSLLHCVPILIESLSPENQRTEIDEWQLVKRFQLIGVQHSNSVKPQIPSYEDVHKLNLYKRIRYVEKFEIRIDHLEESSITIPVIKLSYRTIDLSKNSSLDHIYPFRLVTKLNSKVAGHHAELFDQIVLSFSLLIALVVTILRVYNFKSRRSQNPSNTELCDLACVTEFVLLLFSTVANAFLVIFLVHIFYGSIVYLAHRSVSIRLPACGYWMSSLHILIYAALTLKCFYLSIYFWRLGHIELFFIDWERPKSCDTNQYIYKNNLDTSSVCSSVRTLVSENNVSAWRTFFIANEWITLSCKQKSCVFIRGIIHIMCHHLLMWAFKYQRDPSLELTVIVATYIIVYIMQIVYRLYVLNRIFGCPLQNFVDSCSLANISVFTLLGTSYGFYIHGRSPHGFSDTDISTMLLQLQRESQNMCCKRGLLSDSDQQTYIILPPNNLRIYCENILVPFQNNCNLSQSHIKNDATSIEGVVEKTSISYNCVNRFFCAFIDHAIRDMDYIIKEKTFIEKLLNSEFDSYITNNKGTFYIDTKNVFSQLFLYGNSRELFTLELLLLMTLLMLTANLILSITVVSLLTKLFEYLFQTWIRQNVATKTIIDRRFLF